MDTEIGHIANMLANTESEKTPLQKQLDGLSKIIASIAGVRAGDRRGARADQRGLVRHALHHRRRARGRGDPDRPAGGRHGPAVDRHAGDRRAQRDREAAACGRDPGVDLGDLLGQDRHAHAQQDDRPRDGDPRSEPLHGHRRGIQHAGRDQARRRLALRPRPVPAPDGPVRGRGARRREPDRRPDRGRVDRARRQGRARHRGDQDGLPADRGGPVRLRVQVHGDLPRDDGHRRPDRSCAATSRARPTC